MKLQEIERLYSKKDRAHDWRHILNLKKNVSRLKKHYKNSDENLLKFLIYFHGQKEFVLENEKLFDSKFVQSLIRHNNRPIKIEEKMVCDANTLDNIGKKGIKKAIFIGKQSGRSYEEIYEYLRKRIKRVKFHTSKGKALGEKKIIEMEKIIEKNIKLNGKRI